MDVQRCSQVNENSFVRLYSVNSEKNQGTAKTDQYPLYNFGDQSDWNFYTKWLNHRDPNLKYLPTTEVSDSQKKVKGELSSNASRFTLQL